MLVINSSALEKVTNKREITQQCNTTLVASLHQWLEPRSKKYGLCKAVTHHLLYLRGRLVV